MAGKKSKKSAKVAKKAASERVAAKPALLAGGNPQIAKADGDAPVQAYIAAMPGWKRDVGHRLDALIGRTVPGVRKAIKWNTPFYGVEGRGWFLGMHCFTKYVKVAFFRGASLRPVPPGESKQKDVRWGPQTWDEMMVGWVAYVWERPGTAEELAKNPPSEADMLFDRLDVNGDDVITADEIPQRWRPLLLAGGVKVPEKMTREEFHKFYEELRKRMPKKPADGEKKPADGEKKPEDKPEPAKPPD